jgi:hypothetical protein
MSVTKTMTKKAAKPAKKTVRKVTIDDVWAGFERLEKFQKHVQKSQDEAWEAIRETQKAMREGKENSQKLRDEAWEAIRETQKAMREGKENGQKLREEALEARRETEKSLQRFHDETQKSIKETQQAIKETQQNIGGINNTLGSLVERVMTTDLPRKFKQFGFTFDRITTVKWAGEGNIYAEIDGLLENGAQAMVVEVKTTLREKDIDDHLIRMEKVRAYADQHDDKRQFLGAIAAAITGESAKRYALSKGFFVIEPSGEDIKITKPASDPKMW